MELLNSPAHRALAREAVRRSLVLLKNSGALPIRASARVLVTGPGADSIPMQCGGWSVTWQGNDTSNADFPGAQSVTAAIEASRRNRAADGWSTARISPARIAPMSPCVVYGEQPYAEMHRRPAVRPLQRG